MKASEFLEKLKTINKEKLLLVDGIGEVLADNLLEFVNSERYTKMLTKFKDQESRGIELNIKQTVKEIVADSGLNGKKICITGKFDISREEIKSELEKLGAKCVTAVTTKTDILIVGEDPGSKLTDAQTLGIRIVTDYKELI